VANEVATAARTTLASATARVWSGSFFDPSDTRLERFVTSEEGVTDLARRRTRTEHEMPTKFVEWGARLLERYPWLDDGEADSSERERSRSVVVYAGTASFYKSGDRWTAGDDGEQTALARSPRDPLWIVEALVHADEATARGEDVVRGAACQRWEFRVDPALHHELHDRASGSERRSLRLAGDAWIDDDGRLRRVTWTRLRRRRSRWARRRPGPWPWQTTELWGFGVAVEIEVPTVEPERASAPWPIDLVKIVWKLWLRRRAYRRRSPGA
jgi:hypothetical protein